MNFSEITSSNVCEKLIEVVPSLRPAYDKELNSWDNKEIPPHYAFGPGLFLPYLYAALKSGKQHAELRRIFSFLEILLNHPDDGVASVVANEVIPDLCGHPEVYSTAKKYLGKESAKLANDIVKRMSK